MRDAVFEEALLAGIPSAQAVTRFRALLNLDRATRDIYLAYGGASLRLGGLLVTELGKIDQLIAYCPIHPDLEVASTLWRLDIRRQLKRACSIAEGGECRPEGIDVIPLLYVNDGSREVPAWIYAMACIPVSYEWSGELFYPRPFCPRLFEHMAAQPQASQWLEQRGRELNRFPEHPSVNVSLNAVDLECNRCATTRASERT